VSFAIFAAPLVSLTVCTLGVQRLLTGEGKPTHTLAT
jgi:hypothetical protein